MSEKKTSSNVSIHNRQTASKGDHIIRQGEQGDDAYLIQSGKVRVYAEHNNKTTELAVLGPGEIFGEMALVVDEPRVASVIALENVTLVKITRPMMIDKLGKTDVTIQALMKMMVSRIKGGNDKALYNSGNFTELSNAVESIYTQIEDSLEGAQKKSLEKAVKPQLQAFMDALTEFQKKYS